MQQSICNNKTAPSKADGERAKSDSHQADGDRLIDCCTSPIGYGNQCINQLNMPPGASAHTSKASLRDDQQPVLVLTLTPTPAGRDAFGRTPSYRLKQLLKPLLRSYGFRCDGLEWPKTP
jgi:hypothetical protein